MDSVISYNIIWLIYFVVLFDKWKYFYVLSLIESTILNILVCALLALYICSKFYCLKNAVLCDDHWIETINPQKKLLMTKIHRYFVIRI